MSSESMDDYLAANRAVEARQQALSEHPAANTTNKLLRQLIWEVRALRSVFVDGPMPDAVETQSLYKENLEELRAASMNRGQMSQEAHQNQSSTASPGPA